MFTSRKEFRSLAAALVTAQRSLLLYPSGHPYIKTAMDECYRILRTLLQRERQLPIVLAGNEFVIGSLQVPVVGEAFEELAKTLRTAQVEKLIFAAGLRSWELQALLRGLNTDAATLESAGGVEGLLRAEKVEHVVASTLGLDEGSVEDEGKLIDAVLVRAWETYSAGLRVVRRLRQGFRDSGRLDNLEETKQFVRDMVELGAKQTRPLLALQSLRVHDEYSFTHSINVATLTLVIGQGLKLPKFDLHEVTLAALLHDIGKERVSGDVLRKPGKLNDEEWKQMSDHSLLGAKMLAVTEGVGDLAPIVAYEHHLKQVRDKPGSAKWQLHLVSEMVTIADVYDALRSTRPYRGEIPADKAMEIMHEEAPEKFNPDLFDGFARLVGFYPPGICVQLASGEIGIVHRSNPDDLRRPSVLLVRDAGGARFDKPRRFELSEAPDASIAAVLDAETAEVDPFDYL